MSGGKQRLRRSCSHLQPHSTTVRTIEIIATLVTLFLLSWTPYAVVTLIGQFGDLSLMTPWVSSLPAYFAKASVVYNPIVYGLSHPHFRTSVKQYLSTMRGGATSASHLPPPPPPPTTSSPPPEHCQHMRCFPPTQQRQRLTVRAHFHSEPPDPRTAAQRIGALPPSARRVQISTSAPVCCVVYQSGGGRVCCIRAAPVPPVFDL